MASRKNFSIHLTSVNVMYTDGLTIFNNKKWKDCMKHIYIIKITTFETTELETVPPYLDVLFLSGRKTTNFQPN